MWRERERGCDIQIGQDIDEFSSLSRSSYGQIDLNEGNSSAQLFKLERGNGWHASQKIIGMLLKAYQCHI